MEWTENETPLKIRNFLGLVSSETRSKPTETRLLDGTITPTDHGFAARGHGCGKLSEWFWTHLVKSSIACFVELNLKRIGYGRRSCG
jgi:hypothetical protein